MPRFAAFHPCPRLATQSWYLGISHTTACQGLQVSHQKLCALPLQGNPLAPMSLEGVVRVLPVVDRSKNIRSPRRIPSENASTATPPCATWGKRGSAQGLAVTHLSAEAPGFVPRTAKPR